MIPSFPEFKNIELSDRPEIEKHTRKFPPYSDFNFTSMWTWDIQGEMGISVLNENLVVRFSDYLTGKPFYSFLGDNRVNETIDALFELSRKEGLESCLKLVPESSLHQVDHEKYIVSEERDHFDYIYKIDTVHSYEGSHHKTHRQLVRYFEKNHQYEMKILDISEKENQKMLMDLVDFWVKTKREKAGSTDGTGDYKEDYKNEYVALRRLFSAPKDLTDSLVCFSVFVDGKLSGFMLDEKISDQYCISHFGKTNLGHKGNLQLLMRTSAKKFFDLGIIYYNDEQDLGLQNLRSSKSSYELAHFLKKYTITLRS